MDKLFIYGIKHEDFLKIQEKIKTCKVYALDDTVLNDTVHEVVDVPYMLYHCEEKPNAFAILESNQSGSAWKFIIDGINKIPNCPKMIKVTVTNQNRKWPMHILFDHVLQEDQLFKYRYLLKDLMIESANMMKDHMSQEYQMVLTNAFSVYENQEATLAQVKQAMDDLTVFVEKN